MTSKASCGCLDRLFTAVLEEIPRSMPEARLAVKL